MTELNNDEIEIIQKVEKLLRLAANNPNENERAAAEAKAMGYLEKYNLDMSAIDQGAGDKGRRTDEKMAGGLYIWQRDLWRAVAELHFCMYWNQYRYDATKKRRRFDRVWDEKSWNTKRVQVGTSQGGFTFQHRLVGRKVNVKSTQIMAEYIQQAVERIVRERYPDPKQWFCSSATSYREGLAADVVSRIYDRRRQIMSEERDRAEQARRRADEASKKGVSTETGISLETVAKTEYDANIDFVYGDGTSAKWAQDRAQRAEAKRQADAEYTAWAAANPEEAKKEEEKRRKEERKHANRSSGKARYVKDSSAYWQGREAGKKISIDPQADSRKASALL